MEGWGTLRIVRRARGTALLDASCGACDRCTDGLDFWCTSPSFENEGTLLAELGLMPSEHTLMVVLGLTALAGRSPVRTPVLIETPEVEIAQRIAALLAPAQTFVTDDSRGVETRKQLAAASRTGRAGTVLNVVDHGKAVRAVERGGVVVVTPSAAVRATLTEIVQRELSVVGVTSLAHLRSIGPEPLSEALASEGDR